MATLDVEILIGNLWPIFHATSTVDAIFVTDSELTQYFADYLKRLAMNVGCFVVVDDSFIVLNEGQQIYAAPPLFLDALHITILPTEDLPLQPLDASSTYELENLDDAYQTTQSSAANPIEQWYADKIGPGQLGFYPVPGAGDAGRIAQVIMHSFPCSLDSAHTDVNIDTPAVIGDWLELNVIYEAYNCESDFQMPDAAAGAKSLADMLGKTIGVLWGKSQ
jgi:hypothetical protein